MPKLWCAVAILVCGLGVGAMSAVLAGSESLLIKSFGNIAELRLPPGLEKEPDEKYDFAPQLKQRYNNRYRKVKSSEEWFETAIMVNQGFEHTLADVLKKPDHAITKEELRAVAWSVESSRFSGLRKTSFRTVTINGTRVLRLDASGWHGEYNVDRETRTITSNTTYNADAIVLFVPIAHSRIQPLKIGTYATNQCATQAIAYWAKSDEFPKYRPAIDKSIASIKWR